LTSSLAVLACLVIRPCRLRRLLLAAAALAVVAGCGAPGPGKGRLKAARRAAEAVGLPELLRYPGGIVKDVVERQYDSLPATVYQLTTRDPAELVLAHYREALSRWREYAPRKIERIELAAGFRNPDDGRIVVIEIVARKPRATNVTIICAGPGW
jgi:hypothetical protein